MIIFLAIAALASDNEPVTPRAPRKVHWPHTPERDSIIPIKFYSSPTPKLFLSTHTIANNAEEHAIPYFKRKIETWRGKIDGMSPSLDKYARQAFKDLQSKARGMEIAVSAFQERLNFFHSKDSEADSLPDSEENKKRELKTFIQRGIMREIRELMEYLDWDGKKGPFGERYLQGFLRRIGFLSMLSHFESRVTERTQWVYQYWRAGAGFEISYSQLSKAHRELEEEFQTDEAVIHLI